MQIKLLPFGQTKEILPSAINLPQQVKDTNGLLQYLVDKYPQLARVHFAIAVNEELASSNTAIFENAVVAILPPYSGG